MPLTIAYCTYPLYSNHKDRGIGVYTKLLLSELLKNDYLNIKTFSNPAIPPKADLIHYPYYDIFFHTLPILSKYKRVVTVHDVIPLLFPKKFPLGIRGTFNLFLQGIALKKTNAIICDSDTSRMDVNRIFGVKNDKLHTIYLAPSLKFKLIKDNKKLMSIRQKYNLPEKFILFVSDVNWNKNLETLIKAIQITKIPLVLIGASHLNFSLPEVQQIDLLIKQNNLKQLIIKVGNISQDDLVVIYNLANVTVVPSHYEGFGLPVLESMACGTPVVCSNNSSLSEIGKSYAFLCEPNSPGDIANKILKAIKSKSAQTTNKLIKYSSSFNWEKTASETINIYKSI